MPAVTAEAPARTTARTRQVYPGPALTAEAIEERDAVLLALKGEAGFRETAVLQAHLTAILARKPLLVVLDLAELRFIASMALGMLVEFRRAVLRFGGRLRLVDLRPHVAEVFRRARLDDLFGLS